MSGGVCSELSTPRKLKNYLATLAIDRYINIRTVLFFSLPGVDIDSVQDCNEQSRCNIRLFIFISRCLELDPMDKEALFHLALTQSLMRKVLSVCNKTARMSGGY